MQSKKLQRIVATLIAAVSVGLSGCNREASPEPAASTGGAAARGAPSGVYESQMPGGTAMSLDFRDGGAVTIAMTEDGETNSFDGDWVQNGEVILVEGGEGMTMQLSWRSEALVTDFGGATLTFTKT